MWYSFKCKIFKILLVWICVWFSDYFHILLNVIVTVIFCINLLNFVLRFYLVCKFVYFKTAVNQRIDEYWLYHYDECDYLKSSIYCIMVLEESSIKHWLFFWDWPLCLWNTLVQTESMPCTYTSSQYIWLDI